MMAGLASGTGNKRAPLADRKDDLYETPAVAVETLLRVEAVPDVVWEPACGPGAIVRVLRASGRRVYATDLVDYASPDQDHAGWDFLLERRAPDDIEAIVTNPPFKNCALFVAHALRLSPKVYMLLRLAYLEAGNMQTEASVARRTSLDGGSLARIHVFSSRLPMMHRTGWEGRKANSGMAFAWFVWDSTHSGLTTIDRIDWRAR
jgi:hypothetical protein